MVVGEMDQVVEVVPPVVEVVPLVEVEVVTPVDVVPPVGVEGSWVELLLGVFGYMYPIVCLHYLDMEL